MGGFAEDTTSLARDNIYCQSYRSKLFFSVLCKAVDEKDKEQLEKILPVLQKRLSQATQGLTECLNLRDTAQAW